jgi:heme A synthase
VLVLAREKRPAPKILASAALLLVIAQALLGGIRVRLGETHSYGVATIHAFTAQLFLGTLSATLMSLSPSWSAGAPRRVNGDVTTSGSLVFLGFAAVGAVLLQILLGAGFGRHLVFSRMAAVALGAQLILGVVIYLLVRKADTTMETTAAATVLVAVLHLGFGSVLLFASVGCAFWTLRAPTAARGT